MALVKGEGNLNSFIVVVITLFSYWALGSIVYLLSRENDRVGALWGMGLIYWILYILFYPIRAMNQYGINEKRYRTHGISRIQYLFGRRIKHDED